MTKPSKSKSEDKNREQESRVNKTHGGEVVATISVDDLESFNDAECKHVKLIRDSDEIAPNTFACANEKCNEIFLFDKVKV